jgi:hypothetical protein
MLKPFVASMLLLALGAGSETSLGAEAIPGAPPTAAAATDWPAFMAKQDMRFDRLPRSWTQAPHFGNASIGSMLYQTADNVLRLQVFRADVQDHRDDSFGWPAYSRPRLGIGHFELQTVGKLTGCQWRKDLWNAELTGTITTDRGTIAIRHFVHADDMAIVTELTPSEGEKACDWTWHALPAKPSRDEYPTKQEQVAGFAKKYGPQYADTLKLYQANPDGRLEKRGDTSVWIQDLLAGGQYATAWTETEKRGTRTQLVTIANSYPAATAANTAVADLARFKKSDATAWQKAHRDWWHGYFQQSFITIPDPQLEALYWQTIYRFGCTSRGGRFYVDTPGIWFQGGGWCYTTTDWNTEAAHWSVYTANRLDQGADLLERYHAQREQLIKAVRPVEWQADSAYLPIEVAGDLIGNREQDMRYYNLVGDLPWTMSNFWMQYRYSMDEAMLRDKIYPLLRRSINFYIHMLKEGPDGKLHLPPTYSPESGVHKDCNFDLALLKWGCHILLRSSRHLKIDDPLIPRWKEVIERTIDFPADERGFRIGSDQSSLKDHRHLSHLLMIYPLHLVNIDQPGREEVLRISSANASAVRGLPAMVQTHAAPIAASLGLGEQALEGLKALQHDLHPNGLWYSAPCIESSLAAANIVQEMLLQSWSDPTRDEPGPIRVFPACPAAWQDVTFRDLRAEGAFLVSAERRGGKTAWVRVKSLAGEPCRLLVDGKRMDVPLAKGQEKTLRFNGESARER